MQKWRASDWKIKIIKDITIGEQERESELFILKNIN